MSVRDTADIVIIGGGIEGISAALSIAERGAASVTVLERDAVASGGTGRSSGIVRSHYGVESLAEMARIGTDYLASAPERFGDDVGYREVGYVVGVAPDDTNALRANLEMQRALGVDTREIDLESVAEMFPFADLADFGAFGYEPAAGYGDAARTCLAMASRARELGIEIRQFHEVTGIEVNSGSVTVKSSSGDWSAGRVVVAAGVHTASLAAPLGLDVPLAAQREQLVIVDPNVDLGDVPVFSDLVDLQYLRVEPTSELLFGNSDHSVPEYVTDADRYVQSADFDHIEVTIGKVMHRFPGLTDATVKSSYAGIYDVTPDFNPIIGPVSDSVFLCCGFSGHGFKIAPAVGEFVADLLLDGCSGNPNIPTKEFRLERFAEGQLLTSRHPYLNAGQMR